MATSHSLKAETRACGSGNLKQLRSQGLVPGVVYGPGFDNVNIQVDAREFARMLASAVSEHILVALDINGKIVKVLLKEVQHNPITNACLHVDFQAVTDTTVIHSIVPVILEGDSAGVALGGVLDQTIHELAIACRLSFNLSGAVNLCALVAVCCHCLTIAIRLRHCGVWVIVFYILLTQEQKKMLAVISQV